MKGQGSVDAVGVVSGAFAGSAGAEPNFNDAGNVGGAAGKKGSVRGVRVIW